MLKLLLFAALALSAPFGQAAKRVTVDQLRLCMAQQKAAGESDAQAAVQLSSMALSERLTDATLSRLKAEFHPGERSR